MSCTIHAALLTPCVALGTGVTKARDNDDEVHHGMDIAKHMARLGCCFDVEDSLLVCRAPR